MIWSDENFIGYAQCWICGATGREMSEAKGLAHDFVPKPNVCALGWDPLHQMMRSFDKFNNVAMHWDFKERCCYGNENKYLNLQSSGYRMSSSCHRSVVRCIFHDQKEELVIPTGWVILFPQLNDVLYVHFL